jgi:ribosomal protein S18 acetylase RimI-like enzyme
MTITAVTYVFRNNEELRDIARRLEIVESLNFGSDGFGAYFIAQELTKEGGSAVLLLDDGVVVGYTAAMDAREAYGSNRYYRGRNYDRAAYISNSSIHPNYQHQGHIWMMMDLLEETLRFKGYEFLDRDTKADLGYADKVVARYGNRVVFANPSEDTMWGHQRYIRIRL